MSSVAALLMHYGIQWTRIRPPLTNGHLMSLTERNTVMVLHHFFRMYVCMYALGLELGALRRMSEHFTIELCHHSHSIRKTQIVITDYYQISLLLMCDDLLSVIL